jgi:hypothetical protein
MKFRFVITSAFLWAADPSVASGALTVWDYQDLVRKGTQGEQAISIYLMAVIDAIGMTNEFVIGRKDRPIFCQGDRVITIKMVRDIIDMWIAKNQPTMSPEQWKIHAGRQNLSGAVLYSLKGAMPCE